MGVERAMEWEVHGVGTHEMIVPLEVPHPSSLGKMARAFLCTIVGLVLISRPLAHARGVDRFYQTFNLSTYAPPDTVNEACIRKGGRRVCHRQLNRPSQYTLYSPHCNLRPGEERPKFCMDSMLALLSSVSAVLEISKIPHWLHQGTLLGAVREGSLIPWTNDVDLGFFHKDLDRLLETLRVFEGLEVDWAPQGEHGIPWVVVSNKVHGTHLDFAGFQFLDNATITPNTPFANQCQSSMHSDCHELTSNGYVRMGHVLPLSDVVLAGRRFWAPHRPAVYLEKYYGDSWHVADREGKNNWHSADDDVHVSATEGLGPTTTNAQAAALPHPRVYVDAVCDLLHVGHVALFKKAKTLGQSLIVGIHNDSTVASYKRRPIMTMDERIAVVEALGVVDLVVSHAPLQLSADYLVAHGIDLVVHGDDAPAASLQSMYGAAIEQGMFQSVPYYKGVSTSNIISRVVTRLAHSGGDAAKAFGKKT
jgi:cytidyltransferase-like protein